MSVAATCRQTHCSHATGCRIRTGSVFKTCKRNEDNTISFVSERIFLIMTITWCRLDLSTLLSSNRVLQLYRQDFEWSIFSALSGEKKGKLFSHNSVVVVRNSCSYQGFAWIWWCLTQIGLCRIVGISPTYPRPSFYLSIYLFIYLSIYLKQISFRVVLLL